MSSRASFHVTYADTVGGHLGPFPLLLGDGHLGSCVWREVAQCGVLKSIANVSSLADIIVITIITILQYQRCLSLALTSSFTRIFATFFLLGLCDLRTFLCYIRVASSTSRRTGATLHIICLRSYDLRLNAQMMHDDDCRVATSAAFDCNTMTSTSD